MASRRWRSVAMICHQYFSVEIILDSSLTSLGPSVIVDSVVESPSVDDHILCVRKHDSHPQELGPPLRGARLRDQ